MINKFQLGGKQDAIMQFVLGLAKVLLADPLQVVLIAQLNPDALKIAVQTYQETLNMEQAAQAFLQTLQLKVQAAKHGAKLNYIKTLKNQCAEDEEVVYFKKGGSIGCGCKKKEDGGEIKATKKGTVVDKFKLKWNSKDEHKLDSLSKREAEKKPLTPQGKKDLNNLRNKFKKAPNQKDYELEEGKCGMKVKKNVCGNKIVKKACGSKCEAVTKFKAAKCGAKMKKHELGGSLKHIPFYQEGTSKKGIRRIWDYKKPRIVNPGQENTWEESSFTSRPDLFGRYVTINRFISPSDDGTFNNDTLIGAQIYTPGAIRTVHTNNEKFSPKKILNAPYNTWKDYFNYLLSLRKEK